MVSDQQVRRLWRYMKTEKYKSTAAAKAGMDNKTARKYAQLGKLPSEVKGEHIWRTRKDPFGDVWGEAPALLKVNEGLEAKTIFEHQEVKTLVNKVLQPGHYKQAFSASYLPSGQYLYRLSGERMNLVKTVLLIK